MRYWEGINYIANREIRNIGRHHVFVVRLWILVEASERLFFVRGVESLAMTLSLAMHQRTFASCFLRRRCRSSVVFLNAGSLVHFVAQLVGSLADSCVFSANEFLLLEVLRTVDHAISTKLYYKKIPLSIHKSSLKKYCAGTMRLALPRQSAVVW